MAEQFDAKAVLSASVQGFKEAIDQLKEFKEAGDLSDIIAPLQGYTRSLEGLAGSLGGAGKAARKSGDDIKYAADGFDEYVKAVSKANKAQQEFSQGKVTGGINLDGIPASAAQSMSRGERDDILAVEEARTATILSQIRKVNAAEDAATQERASQEKYLDGLKAKSLQQQLANIQKADAAAKAAEKNRIAALEKQAAAQDSLIAKANATADKGIGAASGYLSEQNNKRVGAIGAADGAAWDREYASALESAERKTRDLEAAQTALYEKSSPRLRYALYDVGRTAAVTAAAITGLGTVVGVTAASFESSFTNVERTLEDGMGTQQVADLRQELVGLTREMPLAFSEITEIATLGNQLGVAGDDVGKFTETVAQFSAVTGISVDAAATAFGSLGELLDVPVNQFENLGSAIAYVGRTSVATEQEIVAMSTRLAASASNAGFSAQQVIALSGAFASLRIAPERAQGVMEVYFKRLNTAISEGGESLAAFGRFAGVASEDVEAMVRSDPNQFFQRLATGLGELDSIAQTRALEQLGLDGIRAGEVFGRVSQNVGVFNKALQDSDNSWAAGSELASQYGKILDDLSTRWTILLNALAEFGAAAGAVIAPVLVDIVGKLTAVIQGFTEFVSTDFGSWFIQTAALVGGFVAALAGIVAVAATAAGGLFAMRLAAVELGIVTAKTTGGIGLLIARLLGLNKTLLATRGASVGAAGGIAAVGGASAKTSGFMATAGRGAAGLAKGFGALFLITELLGWFTDLDGKIQQVSGSLVVSQGAWSDFANNGTFSIEMLYSPLGTLIGMITAAAQALSGLDVTGDAERNFSRGAAGGRKKVTTSLKELKSAGDSISFDDWSAGADDFSSALGDVGESAGEATKEIRTLVDYASDLSSVMQRAFDIRFGGQQGLDAITAGWRTIRDAADEARKAAQEHRRELASMGADRKVKQYWLMVAENYGDELRAAKLRAELAELDGDMAKTKKELTTEQDKANMSLTGNSAAAIANRAALLGLVGNYQEYLRVLAASGASQATLQAESVRLRGEFVRQAASMGFGRTEVNRYAAAFGDMTTVIARVPRNITVRANVKPALQALNEFKAAARSAASSAAASGRAAGSNFANGAIAGADATARAYAALQTALDVARSLGDLWNTSTYNRGRRGGYSRGGTFASGGYTGDGGTSEVAGVVHGKEFVMSAPAVKAAGGPNAMAYMHNMLKAGKGFGAVGVGAGGGGGMVELSPYDRSLLQGIQDNIGLTISQQSLQSVVNGSNGNVAQRRGA